MIIESFIGIARMGLYFMPIRAIGRLALIGWFPGNELKYNLLKIKLDAGLCVVYILSTVGGGRGPGTGG